ncbi:DUF2167 domain-containing protein [Neisseria sp. P0008.S010]|uniref:DUF2167 domain-containing protein n=1 Tax=Neisseria sp. P0008.S010 TaxID=3436707 RepID=UPI003F7EC821
MMKNNRLACAVLAALLSIQTLPASAAKPDTASAVGTPSQNNPAPADAGLPADLAEQMVVGPAVIDLGNQAKLKLPAKMVFIKKEAANTMMEEAGNGTDPNRYGLILPEQENDESDTPWLVDLTFTNSGYIKDDDAKEWDVETMLEQLKEGTTEQNKERAARNLPELETRGWVEKPQYDAANHRLIWSIDVYHKNEPNQNPSINYNTFQLGREGYIELTMVSDLKSIEAYKPVARELLGNIEFNEGKRYSDFNAATDKVAEYGLAALVGGLAAKKLGLLAVIGALLAKFGKLIFVGVVAVGALFKGLWRKKDKNQSEE